MENKDKSIKVKEVKANKELEQDRKENDNLGKNSNKDIIDANLDNKENDDTDLPDDKQTGKDDNKMVLEALVDVIIQPEMYSLHKGIKIYVNDSKKGYSKDTLVVSKKRAEQLLKIKNSGGDNIVKVLSDV